MNEKHYQNMKAQGQLLKWLEDNDMSYERALQILEQHSKTQKKQIANNEELTKMGRYLNAATLTPQESGMSPGRCPI